jgi:hypothetical protein
LILKIYKNKKNNNKKLRIKSNKKQMKEDEIVRKLILKIILNKK